MKLHFVRLWGTFTSSGKHSILFIEGLSVPVLLNITKCVTKPVLWAHTSFLDPASLIAARVLSWFYNNSKNSRLLTCWAAVSSLSLGGICQLVCDFFPLRCGFRTDGQSSDGMSELCWPVRIPLFSSHSPAMWPSSSQLSLDLPQDPMTTCPGGHPLLTGTSFLLCISLRNEKRFFLDLSRAKESV